MSVFLIYDDNNESLRVWAVVRAEEALKRAHCALSLNGKHIGIVLKNWSDHLRSPRPNRCLDSEALGCPVSFFLLQNLLTKLDSKCGSFSLA